MQTQNTLILHLILARFKRYLETERPPEGLPPTAFRSYETEEIDATAFHKQKRAHTEAIKTLSAELAQAVDPSSAQQLVLNDIFTAESGRANSASKSVANTTDKKTVPLSAEWQRGENQNRTEQRELADVLPVNNSNQ